MDSLTTLRPEKMRIVRFRTLDELAPLASDWDRLARGVPFRSWAWMSSWWRHYGQRHGRHEGASEATQLFVLGVVDRGGTVRGFAPWYLENSVSQGRVLRSLGTGEVCSDYLAVLSERGAEDPVADALAGWLTEANRPDADRPTGRDPDRWDLLDLRGIDAEDNAIGRLAEQLEARGNTVHRRAGPNCWRIELPSTWEQYLTRLSRNHRKQIRRAERTMFATGTVAVRRVERLPEMAEGQEILIDLHQRRRRSLGEPGCFASARFLAFHCEVMPELLRNGQLRLVWLELEGRPIAAEYHLAGSGVVYAYQAGISPDALSHSPGRLITIVTLRRAIEEGYRAYDLLRGDEPYKAHWRAQPRASLELRVVPARVSARWRHGIWLTGTSVKEWIKGGLRLVAEEEG